MCKDLLRYLSAHQRLVNEIALSDEGVVILPSANNKRMSSAEEGDNLITGLHHRGPEAKAALAGHKNAAVVGKDLYSRDEIRPGCVELGRIWLSCLRNDVTLAPPSLTASESEDRLPSTSERAMLVCEAQLLMIKPMMSPRG